MNVPIPAEVTKHIRGLLENWEILYGVKINPEDLEDLYRLGYCEGGLAALKQAETALAQ